MTETEDIVPVFKEISEMREKYAALKETASKAHEELRGAEGRAIDMMMEKGVTAVAIAGDGTYSLSSRKSWAYPKEGAERAKFLEFVEGKIGKEALDGLLTVNSRSFNKFMREMEGSGVTAVPGVGEPAAMTVLSKRKITK